MELKSVKITFVDGSEKRFQTYQPYNYSTVDYLWYEMIGHGGVKAQITVVSTQIRTIEVFDSEKDEYLSFTPA